ncbi:ATPase [Robiginitalea sp. M366]|uniref:ATPase n=1 Tax=Robiginitalea aestuariiviva TaxID=3036903 RepID=UPI00240DCDAC|nr:ATPase [Robiginitalea aestuariiviva]MDG1573305.1 ATPase [Robiginitalea aestuariiviva]
MNFQAPHLIVEGNRTFRLGSIQGREIHYEFSRIRDFLEFKGKQLFGETFQIYPEDHGILTQLIHYFIKDEIMCKNHGIDPDKGILLSGPIGCGKTSFMRLLKLIVPHKRPYSVLSSRNIVFAYNHIGSKALQDYGDHGSYCFDDLGVEPSGKHFGQECNVLGEILLSRYELFVLHKVKTHATTNLNAQELEDRYGNRVRSRMRELFNLIAFDADSKDKRR